MKKKRPCRIAEKSMALLVAAMAFSLTNCGRTSAGAAEPTAPEVEVAAVEQKDIPVYREWIGTLDGQVNAAIRSQVTGYLLTQDYSEGSFVKKGQMLFQIDPRPLQADIDSVLIEKPNNGKKTKRTSYNGFFFVTLKPWDKRTSRAEQFQEIKTRLNQQLNSLAGGIAFSFSPPAIPGVGTSGGFQFVLEDRAGRNVQFLGDNLARFLAAAQNRPEIGFVSTTFLPHVPQRFVDVDRDNMLKQGVPLSDVYRTIQAYMGGLFINYFNDFGRQWQVYVEAEADYRATADNLGQFFVRNSQGDMVPLSALATFAAREGPNSPCATTSTALPKSMAARRPATARTRRRLRWRRFSNRPCPTKWDSTTWACLIRSRKPERVCRLRSFSRFRSVSSF
jgi:hypothetical protein